MKSVLDVIDYEKKEAIRRKEWRGYVIKWWGDFRTSFDVLDSSDDVTSVSHKDALKTTITTSNNTVISIELSHKFCVDTNQYVFELSTGPYASKRTISIKRESESVSIKIKSLDPIITAVGRAIAKDIIGKDVL